MSDDVMVTTKDGARVPSKDVEATREIERQDGRTLTSKVFVLGTTDDGKEVKRTSVSVIPQHYHDGTRLRTIAPRWFPQPDGSWLLDGAPLLITVLPGEMAWTVDNRKGEIITERLVRIGSETAFNIQPVMDGEHRLHYVDVVPGFDIVLVGHAYGVSTHHLIMSPSAPKEVAYQIIAPVKGAMVIQGGARGRDNLNKADPNRVQVLDFYRLLEVSKTRTAGRDLGDGTEEYEATTTWTGRVLREVPRDQDPEWVDDVTYPVRMI